jgi:hypothetical protein
MALSEWTPAQGAMKRELEKAEERTFETFRTEKSKECKCYLDEKEMSFEEIIFAAETMDKNKYRMIIDSDHRMLMEGMYPTKVYFKMAKKGASMKQTFWLTKLLNMEI